MAAPLFNYDWIFAQSAASQCYQLSGQQIMTILALADRFKWTASWYSPTDAAMDADAIDALVDNLQSELMLGGICPGGNTVIGSIFAVATIPPAGTLKCDGTQYLRIDYPDLYAILDAAFIVDADNFVVPDLRNRMVVGSGDTYSMDDSGGAATHTLVEAEMPPHSHDTIHSVYTQSEVKNRAAPATGTYARVATEPTTETGGGLPHNNMPPYRALIYVIVCQ